MDIGNLVITRKSKESVWVGDTKVTINWVRGNKVSLKIQAPKTTKILREEVRAA